MKAHPNLHYEVIDTPTFRQETCNAVLWDCHSGDPFFLPPGRDPMHYLAKGFKTTPPKGYKMHPDRPYRPPAEPIPEAEWEPDGYVGPLQVEFEKKLAEMNAERDKEQLEEKLQGQSAADMQETMKEFIELQKQRLELEMTEARARLEEKEPVVAEIEPMRTEAKPEKAKTLVAAQEFADNEGPKGKQSERAKP